MNTLTEQQVADYLLQTPDFLLLHHHVLESLNLQQEQAGTHSLFMRQQRVLRERNQQLIEQQQQLIHIAKKNEIIYQVFSACHRHLLIHNSFDELALNITTLICNELTLKECKLIKYKPELDSIISHRLTEQVQYLGRINKKEQEILFASHCQSTALYLIGEPKHPLAILAFSSDDDAHFSPTQDSFFILEFVKALAIKLAVL